MKHVILKFKYLFLAGLSILTFACSDGEDGAIGPAGPQGEQGTGGENGINGNANVQSFTYDLTAVSGSFYDQSIPEITQDVIDNDLVLGFLQLDGSTRLYPLPNTNLTPLGIDVRTFVNFEVYSMDFYRRNESTVFPTVAGQLNQLKVLIIESTNRSSTQSILSDLKAKGVDTNNYNAIMKYFNKEK